MKILKVPDNSIFDTEDKDYRVYTTSKLRKDELLPLHQHPECLMKNCFEFLRQFFPLEHFIYSDFGKSYYYVISDEQITQTF